MILEVSLENHHIVCRFDVFNLTLFYNGTIGVKFGTFTIICICQTFEHGSIFYRYGLKNTPVHFLHHGYRLLISEVPRKIWLRSLR